MKFWLIFLTLWVIAWTIISVEHYDNIKILNMRINETISRVFVNKINIDSLTIKMREKIHIHKIEDLHFYPKRKMRRK